ncbi:MAG: short-chain dehydrogenase/reductase [Polyangiaceae bacterium]|jgi:short-subunit dehydrogenase|nr:short-chain dehydrogenase/reductase [Polyangiaceae bacterium]
MAKRDVFSGTTALVTGASSGLGEEFARELARRHANLVLTARSLDKLQQLAADLSRVNGVQVQVIAQDLAEPDGALTLARELKARNIAVDHLINNAGFGTAGRFESMDVEREARMIRVNCESVTVLSRSLLRGMLDRKRGGILNVASTAGHQPTPFMTTYGASKAFVLSFTLALAEELRGTGVHALALCPGPVPTGFQAAASIPSGAVLSFAKLDAHTVVERALDAYARRAVIETPGFVNSVQTLASKVFPRSLVVRAARLTMTKLGRISG